MATETKEKSIPAQEEKLSGIEKVINFFSWIVMFIAIAMMAFTVVSVMTFDQNDRDVLGYKALIVRSDSMSATDFSAGDLILVKEVDPSTLQAGDIVAFTSLDPNSMGETFTHKIRSTTTYDGQPAFITYGTTTGVDDEYPVTYSQILGQYQRALKGVGTFFNFLKTVPGYICCIFVPFMLLILIQGINSVKLFRQYKAEQMAEIDAKRKEELEQIEAKRQKDMEEMAAEREKLEAERIKSQQMMEELLKMKEQMMAMTGAPAEVKAEQPEQPETVSEETKQEQQEDKAAALAQEILKQKNEL